MSTSKYESSTFVRENLDPESPMKDRLKANYLFKQMNDLSAYLFDIEKSGKNSSESGSISPMTHEDEFSITPKTTAGIPEKFNLSYNK